MQAFEYIAILRTKQNNEEKTILLTKAPLLILANGAEAAKMKAIRDVQLADGESIDDVEVIVRPFA